MKLKKTLLFLFLLPLFAFTLHKYYVSLTQIEYNKKEHSLQIITNVFTDDIELALNKKYHLDLQLESKNELKNNDVYFKKYLEEKLHIKINDTIKKIKYIGKEYDKDLIYFYLEVPNIKEIKTIEVTNTILTDYFPNQQNLVKIKVHKNFKSVLLTKENDKGLLNF